MSEANPFQHPSWQFNFGPALCLPHLVQSGWMFTRRLYSDDGGWMSQPDGITLPLAPLTDPGTHANLGLKLAFRHGDAAFDYYIEYVKPSGWNRGLQRRLVFIRRMANVGGKDTSIILGSIPVPVRAGVQAAIQELSGNTLFQVEWFGADDRVLKVTAKKMHE